jgi:hypothetical protein
MRVIYIYVIVSVKGGVVVIVRTLYLQPYLYNFHYLWLIFYIFFSHIYTIIATYS